MVAAAVAAAEAAVAWKVAAAVEDQSVGRRLLIWADFKRNNPQRRMTHHSWVGVSPLTNHPP